MAKSRNSTDFRTSIGGQALIEGILMRGPDTQAIVVRTKDGLKTKVEPVKKLSEKCRIFGWPVIRGAVAYIATLVNGMTALSWSAEQAGEDDDTVAEEPSKLDRWLEAHLSKETAGKVIIAVAVVLGVALSVGLFFLIPSVIASLLLRVIHSNFIVNLIEGLVRIAILLVYMWIVSRMKEIKRVWMYHGAEHKTIACYEAGLELTVDNCRPQTRFHPRCGTSFLLIVMVVSVLVFSLISWKGGVWENPFLRLIFRLALLPVVLGLSYEVIKYAGRHDNRLTAVISAPGKALQRLTTAEPDDGMLEVAIEALKLVIPDEKGKDEW